MKAIGFFFIFLIAFPLVILAQNTQTIDSFTLLDARTNKEFSLVQYNNSKAIVIIFTSNTCPYSIRYEDRILALEKEYRDKGIRMVLINSNFSSRGETENTNQMATKARNYAFPFLIDDSQSAAEMLGAKKNPEAFLVIPANGKFRVVYQGAIDNNPQVETDVSEYYLKNAIEQVLANKKVDPAYVNPAGCVIRKN